MSLLELLVALLAMALLLSAAVPGYQRWLLQCRRALAWSELLQVQARQEQFYLETGGYAQRLSELGLPGDIYTIDAGGVRRNEGANGAIYRVEQQLQGANMIIRAVAHPAGADPGCPVLQLDMQMKWAIGPSACR